jgi:hypothetical protein
MQRSSTENHPSSTRGATSLFAPVLIQGPKHVFVVTETYAEGQPNKAISISSEAAPIHPIQQYSDNFENPEVALFVHNIMEKEKLLFQQKQKASEERDKIFNRYALFKLVEVGKIAAKHPLSLRLKTPASIPLSAEQRAWKNCLSAEMQARAATNTILAAQQTDLGRLKTQLEQIKQRGSPRLTATPRLFSPRSNISVSTINSRLAIATHGVG